MKNDYFCIGRHENKSSIIYDFLKYVLNFPTNEHLKLLNNKSLDEISKYLRYRFPEEDK